MSEEDFNQEDAFLRETQRNEEQIRREKMRDLDFGLSVQKFLDGPIGQRMLSDAEEELKLITNEMYDLNINLRDDHDRMQSLLFRANILRHWQNAFGHYIIAGQNAERELEQMG